MPAYQGVAVSTLQMVCSLIVNTMLATAPEILDLPADQPAAELAMVQASVQQLQLILLGAAAWRTDSGLAPGTPVKPQKITKNPVLL